MSACACVPDLSGNAVKGANSSTQQLFATVSLPENATITAVDARLFDNNSTDDVQWIWSSTIRPAMARSR